MLNSLEFYTPIGKLIYLGSTGNQHFIFLYQTTIVASNHVVNRLVKGSYNDK
jgi:hypothetical protein